MNDFLASQLIESCANSKRVRNRRDYRRFSCLMISIGTEGNKHEREKYRKKIKKNNIINVNLDW